MSKQIVQALEVSLQDGTFSEVSREVVKAHLAGDQVLLFSRLRRFLLGDSLSVESVEQFLEPLIIGLDQAHRYTDLALQRLGPSRTLRILQKRKLPTRFRGVIEFLRKCDDVPRVQAGWIATRLIESLAGEGASVKTFELLELLSLCGEVPAAQADLVVKSLLEMKEPHDLLRGLVSRQDGVEALLGCLTAALSSCSSSSLWSELEGLPGGTVDELEPRKQVLVLLLLSVQRSPEQNARIDESLAFLLRDFPELPVTQAFRRDFYIRGLEQLPCRQIGQQYQQLIAPGLESFLIKALLREAPPSIQTLVVRHRSFLARPFAAAVAQGELSKILACLRFAESAGIHQPMLFFFAWEVYGLEEKGHAEMSRRFQWVQSRRLHVRREGEELNPVAFLRTLRAISSESTVPVEELLEFLLQLKAQPYYDPKRSLDDMQVLLQLKGSKRNAALSRYLESAQRRESYQDTFCLGEEQWN